MVHSSTFTSSITRWYTAAFTKDKYRLQHMFCSAEKVIGCDLPSLQDLYTSRSLRQVGKIVDDPPTLDSPAVHKDQNRLLQEQLLSHCIWTVYITPETLIYSPTDHSFLS